MTAQPPAGPPTIIVPATSASVGTDLEAADLRRDAADLRRSMRITLLSYIIKLSNPVLLIIVIRWYGAEIFGVFAVVTALLAVMQRVCLLGLDRGLLFWIPRQPPDQERSGLLPTLLITSTTSTLLALATMAALAPWIAEWADHPEVVDSLRLMALGLVPMTLLEVLVSAAVAKRRIEAHVIVKEGVVSQVLVLTALALHALGFGAVGLPIAFTVSYAVGLVSVLWVVRRGFAGSQWVGSRTRPPRELMRYSLGMWVAEIFGMGFHHLDVLMLAAFTDPITVGVYRGGLQLAQQVSAVRASFQPLITAVVAEIGLKNHPERIRQSFSHAVIMVLALQMPLVALIFAFAAWILPVLGPGFAAGTVPSLILTVAFLVYGSFGMAGQIVQGYGYTRLEALNVGFGLSVGLVAHAVLIPQFGIHGAAIAAALAFVALPAAQIVESRFIVGIWCFSRDLQRFVALGLAATVAMTATWYGLTASLGPTTGAYDRHDALVRLISLAAFATIFTLGWRWLRQTNRWLRHT